MLAVTVLSGCMVAFLALWAFWRLVVGIFAEVSAPPLEWDLTRASIGRMLRVAGRSSVPVRSSPKGERRLARRYEPLEAGDVDAQLEAVRS